MYSETSYLMEGLCLEQKRNSGAECLRDLDVMGCRDFYLEVSFLSQTQDGSDLKLPQPNDCLVSAVKCVWWSQLDSW